MLVAKVVIIFFYCKISLRHFVLIKKKCTFVAGCRFFWQVYYVREYDITTQYHTQMDSFFHSPGEESLPQKSPTHMDDPDNLPF
jgi:hypothetical protein